MAAKVFTARRPWCYDALFDHVRASWDAHDLHCESLEWFWPGHSGGVSALTDITSCEDCDVIFFNEGLTNVTWQMPDTDALWLCSCCARKRGYDVHGRLSQDMTGALIDFEEFDPSPAPTERNTQT